MAETDEKRTEESVAKPVVDYDIWGRIQELAKGDANSKIHAAELIFTECKKIPRDSWQLIASLAAGEQPKELRLRIAQLLSDNKRIPTGMYFAILKQISKDGDEEIKKIVLKELTGFATGLASPTLANLDTAIRLSPTLSALAEVAKENQGKFAALLASQNILSNALQQEKLSTVLQSQTALAEVMRKQTELASMVNPIFFTQIPTKEIVDFTKVSESLSKLASKSIISLTPHYFESRELELAEEPVKMPSKTKGKSLLEKLAHCDKGRKHWRKYEDICVEILTYCLSPPFQDPLVQKPTRTKVHKRDIIFPLPPEVNGFWRLSQAKYGVGMGIVVECKNYSSQLKENQIIITSKYLGKKKWTSFGLVVTRIGVHENGRKAQVRAWDKEDVMIVCLNDNDLAKMLELKEKDKDPSIVIEKAVSDFLLSIE